MALRNINRRTVHMADSTLVGTSNQLKIPIYHQEQSNWCWDACFQMVFSYFHFSISQCNIAQQVPWQTYHNCCGKPGCCNYTAIDSQINTGWSKWGYTYDYNFAQIAYGSIIATINSGKAIEAGLGWANGGGHVILVIGYSTNQRVYINDPSHGALVVTYSYLQSAYNQGVWDATWNDLSN